MLASASVFDIFPLFVSLLPARGGGAPIIFIVGTAFILVVWILVFWAWLRLSILFPAIAVDAPGADWQSVMADTRGYAWQIFFIMLLAALPILAAIIALAVVSVVTEREKLAIDVGGAVLEFPWTTLMIVIASRLYQWLGNRVNRPRPV